MKGAGKLFLCEHRPEILGVDPGVATIPLFGIDVPSSGKGVRLGTEFSRVETNDKIKLGKEFRPPGLPVSQHLRGGEILQVLVVGNNVDWRSRALKIMVPTFEGFKNSQ